MKALPKLVITDIDGVWTDGGMIYSSSGEELKKFNTKDSVGVLFCQLLEIPVAIMTGEKCPMVQRRAEKLKIERCFIGSSNKLQLAKDLCSELGITLEEVAFVGDEINDLELLEAVGYSACPADAPYYIKKAVDTTLDVNGGEGAFRSFVNSFLTKEQIATLITRYKEQKRFNQ